MNDGYKTKIVQSMLREYCTLHIRESSLYLSTTMCNICDQGSLTGKKQQIIPWGTLVKDPSSWITDACVPHGFEWKDPSKIQVGEVFRLLDHWRDRQDRGLDPLIWIPTSPLFQDAAKPSKHVRSSRPATTQFQEDSDQEVFILPQSDDLDEEDTNPIDKGSSDSSSSSDDSSNDSKSVDVESPTMDISHPLNSKSGEYDTSIVILHVSHMCYAASSEDSETHASTPPYHPNIYRSSPPGKYLIHILNILFITLSPITRHGWTIKPTPNTADHG
jgi:hypothetical protein